MLSLQAARTQTPSSHLNLLFSPFACAQHHLLRAQGSQSTAAANTAAERTPPSTPIHWSFSECRFLSFCWNSLATPIWWIKMCWALLSGFKVEQRSMACVYMPNFSPLRTITSLQTCGAGSRGPVSQPCSVTSMGTAFASFPFAVIYLPAFVFFPGVNIAYGLEEMYPTSLLLPRGRSVLF